MTAQNLSEVEVYNAIQKGISETDDISFKLIGFVPLVTGGGLLTILLGGTDLPVEVLAVTALFAAAATIGLFWWELWNIQTCHWYINLAYEFEKKVFENQSVPANLAIRRRPPGGVGKHNAAKIIYAATAVSWIALPLATSRFWSLDRWEIALFLVGAVVILSETIRATRASTDPSDSPEAPAGQPRRARTA